jgi:hypothetical protein
MLNDLKGILEIASQLKNYMLNLLSGTYNTTWIGIVLSYMEIGSVCCINLW